MILVDTSVWVDHLRRGDAGLVDLLERSAVLMHPFVVGEIACGSLRDRDSILELLQDLPAAVVASPDEVLKFIDSYVLHGKGIGYVDVHLLASVALTPGTRLWTRDTKLRRTADLLGCAHPESARLGLAFVAEGTALACGLHRNPRSRTARGQLLRASEGRAAGGRHRVGT